MQLTPEHQLDGEDLDLTAEAEWATSHPQHELEQLVSAYVRTVMDGPLEYARRLEGQVASLQNQVTVMHQQMGAMRDEMRSLLDGGGHRKRTDY